MHNIDFSDVPRKDAPTFLFIPSAMAEPLDYALRQAGMTGWSIKAICETEHCFTPAAAEIAARHDPEKTRVLVSWFDTRTMSDKLPLVSASPDFAAHIEAGKAMSAAMDRYAKAWASNPAPFKLPAPRLIGVPAGLFSASSLPHSLRPTFLFFAAAHKRYVNCALQSAGETGWAISVPAKIKQFLPDGFQTPEVRLHPGAPRVERSVAVLVSYLEPTALEKKFKFSDMSDPVNKWLSDKAAQEAKKLDYDEAWTKDPPPFQA